MTSSSPHSQDARVLARAAAGSNSTRRAMLWARVRDSLWFIPSLATVLACVLAFVAVQLPTPRTESRIAWIWLFGGGAEGARGVLSTIAGSLITVTGVVFSVTIVALQLASSQFTPRLLRSFVADRTNQVVLGIFIGTFTYTLLLLRSIHSQSDASAGGGATASAGAGSGELFVPQIGVTIALVLLLVSVGALIVFINHAARSVQASVILHRESRLLLGRIHHIFPEAVGEPSPEPAPELPPEPPALVRAAESGYLQAVQGDALWTLAEGRRLLIRMELRVGAFAMVGTPLAAVWPAHLADADVERGIREAFVLGPERTPEQDVEFGLMEISDIAVKALSPGINDPRTAMQSIDRLTEALGDMARRRPPPSVRTGEDGSVRFIAQRTSFARAAGLAFDEIRHYGASNPSIAKKLLHAVIELAAVLPADAHESVAALEEQVQATLHAVREEIGNPVDRRGVEKLAEEAAARLRASRPGRPTGVTRS